MQKATFTNQFQDPLSSGNGGRPTIPSGRQPIFERKFADPSSTQPRGKGYPVPAFLENRVKNVEQ